MRALKCTVLFFSAVLIHTIGHEVVRARAAEWAGMPNTLYHYFILYDTGVPTPDPGRVILYAFAPIAWSLLLALTGALLYTRVQSAASKLFALYLAGAGAIGVLTPLAFAALPGNLLDILTWLELPAAASVAVSVTGALLFLVVMWELGRRAQPPASALVVPLVLGTAARMLAYSPAPLGIYISMAGGSAAWLVAIAGAVWEMRRSRATAPFAATSPLPPMRLASTAIALPLLLIVIVRYMAGGIRFGP